MNYSTLQEAYNIDTFEKKSKVVQKQNKNNGSMIVSSNTSPSFVETSKLALNSNKVSDYSNNQGSSCSPLQAPNYNIPISNSCKKEHDDAMNVYTNLNSNNNQGNNQGNNQVNNQGNNQGNNHNNNNMTNNTPTNNLKPSAPTSTNTSSLNCSANIFNDMKVSNDNVMPYYEEDLEQYFNINNLNDEVKYKSNTYMPNSNKQSYANNDTSEYSNTLNIPKHGNNLLNNSGYNLTPEEKKNAENAIMYLKSIEDKINSGYDNKSIVDPVIIQENTGPGGFKTPVETEPIVKPEPTEKSDKPDKPINNYIYNAIFNISILLITGIVIILLCDHIVELSIHIGMKRAVYILEPLIKAQINANEIVNN